MQIVKRFLKNKKLVVVVVIIAPLVLAAATMLLSSSFRYSADAGCTTEVPLYKQTASPWGDDAYGYKDEAQREPATIASSGCGPTSLAMVLAYLMKNPAMKPDAAARYCLQNNYRPPGGGTDPACFNAYAREKGFRAEQIDANRTKQLLRQSIPIIMVVKNCQIGADGRGRYTGSRDDVGGHYIVLKKIRQAMVNGQEKTIVEINDPNKNNLWDYPENIFGSCAKRGYWYIHR